MKEEKTFTSLETIADIYLVISLIIGVIMTLFGFVYLLEIGIFIVYGLAILLQGFIINVICDAIATIGRTLLKIESNTKVIK